MMAIDNNMKLSSATEDESSSTDNNQRRPSMCSGLSALILAATSQLGHLVDTDFATNDAASQVSHHSGSHAGDGYASSCDGDLLPSTTAARVMDGTSKRSLPQVLMTLLVNPEYADVITFLPDGKFFAIRQREFTEQLLEHHFQVTSFEKFLDLMGSWGFTRISGDNSNSSIQVFRHPHFKKAGSKDLHRVRFDGSGGGGQQMQQLEAAASSTAGSAAVPSSEPQLQLQQDGIERKGSEDSGVPSSSKRRLSPSHLTRDAEDQSLKARAIDSTDPNDRTPESIGSYVSEQPISAGRTRARRRSSIEARSIALAVTTAKLNIGGEDESIMKQQVEEQQQAQSIAAASVPLEEGAVESVTQSIVTDAIETLLFDVGHTRETFLKHEKELSTSAFPNVVPISKQLFSEQGQTGDDQQLHLDEATMPPSSSDNTTSQTSNAASAEAAATVHTSPSISHLEAAGQLSSLAKKGS